MGKRRFMLGAVVGATVLAVFAAPVSAQNPYDAPSPGGYDSGGVVFVQLPDGSWGPAGGGRGTGSAGGSTVPPFNGPYCRTQNVGSADGTGGAFYGFGEELGSLPENGGGNSIPAPPDAADNPITPGVPAILLKRECGNFRNGVFVCCATTTWGWTFNAPPPPPAPPTRNQGAAAARARIRWVGFSATFDPAPSSQIVRLPAIVEAGGGLGALSATAAFPGGYRATATAVPTRLLFDPGDGSGRVPCSGMRCEHTFERSSALEADLAHDGLVQVQYTITYTFSWGAPPVTETFISPFGIAPDFVVAEVQGVNS